MVQPPSPIPSLEQIATPITSPIEEGPGDIIPGLLPKHGQLVIAGLTNVGKAQPLNALILTPNGWKQMGDLQVGDYITSPLGGSSRILHIYPQGAKQIYRVTFTDGRSAEVCGEHLWEVYHPSWTKSKVHYVKGVRHKQHAKGMGHRLMTTNEIAKLSLGMRSRVCIMPPPPIEPNCNPEPLPIDPYLLGVLLGDGSLSSVQLTTSDEEIITNIKAAIPAELEIRKLKSAKYCYSIVLKSGPAIKGHAGSVANPLKESLRTLGLLDKKSPNKFIPEVYMTASISDRQRLVQGLMDTDGYVAKSGHISFTSTSKSLIDQFTYLIRSLGGLCSISTKMGGYKKGGIKITTRLAYTARISHITPQLFVTLTRKRLRLSTLGRQYHLRFKDIQPTRIAEAQCINIDHPRGLYITNDFVVTHNSLTALEICSSLVSDRPLWGELVPTLKAKKILYVLGEHYTDVIKKLWIHTGLPMNDQVWLLGPEQLSYDKWLVTQGKPNIAAISKFQKWATGCDLIVFDPFSAFVTGIDVENDNIQMRLVLDTMSLIAQTAGASCLVLAHQGKPMMDKYGQEHSRKSYAIRGASAIEDAATNIFYMSRGEGESEAAQRATSGQIFELVCRKYKGDAPERYRLLRDQHNLTHTLLGNRPFVEVRKIDAQAKIARVQGAFPDIPFTDVIKILAAIDGVSESTVRRYLGVK